MRATDSKDAGEPLTESTGPPLDPLSFYEDEGVLDAYRQVRDRPDGPKLAIEEPTVLEFLGDLRGRALLDLGCGEARLGREAFRRGARAYLGLDGSRRMVELARQTLAGTDGQVRLRNLESWRGEHGARFEVVVSQLALQYVTRLRRVFEVVRRQLQPEGLFVFSVEHPIVTSSYQGEAAAGIAAGWYVRDYFREGGRVDAWLDSSVVKQHRALQTYIGELRRCGFRLERFSEGCPDAARFADRAVYEKRLEVPLCAIFQTRVEQ